jgi:hypothetical protein
MSLKSFKKCQNHGQYLRELKSDICSICEQLLIMEKDHLLIREISNSKMLKELIDDYSTRLAELDFEHEFFDLCFNDFKDSLAVLFCIKQGKIFKMINLLWKMDTSPRFSLIEDIQAIDKLEFIR